MRFPQRLNNSFVHGALAWLIFGAAPYLHSLLMSVASLLLCVYAGWTRRSSVALFAGGFVVAMIGWYGVAGLIDPRVFAAMLVFMAPLALIVNLATALGAYAVGKFICVLAHRNSSGSPAP